MEVQSQPILSRQHQNRQFPIRRKLTFTHILRLSALVCVCVCVCPINFHLLSRPSGHRKHLLHCCITHGGEGMQSRRHWTVQVSSCIPSASEDERRSVPGKANPKVQCCLWLNPVRNVVSGKGKKRFTS